MGDSKLAAPALLVVAILIGMRLFSLASPPLPPPRCSFVTTASTTVSTTASTSMGDSKPATALLVVVILIGTSPPPPMSPPRACVAFPRPCRLPPPLLPPPALATSPRPRHLPPPVLPPPALVASPHPCRLPPSRFSIDGGKSGAGARSGAGRSGAGGTSGGGGGAGDVVVWWDVFGGGDRTVCNAVQLFASPDFSGAVAASFKYTGEYLFRRARSLACMPQFPTCGDATPLMHQLPSLPPRAPPHTQRSSHVPSPRPNNPAPRGPSPHPNNPAPRVPSPCPNNTAPRMPSPPLFPCDAPPVCVSSVSEINASVKSIGDDLRVHSRLPPMRPSHAPLIPFPLHACVSSTTKMGASVKSIRIEFLIYFKSPSPPPVRV
ncbi:unnamed protein product [Closterium sp. NIES-54]